MLKIKDIEKYIDDDMLDTIFKEKEEELYNEKELNEDSEISKIKEEYFVNYDRLLVAIKNLSPRFHNTREEIIKALESYTMREILIMAYDNEKFYKARFCNGLRTILESIKNSK